MKNRTRHAEAAAIVLGGGLWVSIWNEVYIRKSEVAGIESLAEDWDDDRFWYFGCAHGWLHGDHRRFHLDGGYEVTPDGCEVWGSISLQNAEGPSVCQGPRYATPGKPDGDGWTDQLRIDQPC